MQLTAAAREAEPTVAVHGGFTLVEEDDVAFTLSLCREVHRLYGLYQDGELPPAPHLEAGLQATIEMLAVVNRSVTTGMPAMRITVAAAQVTEMLAVLFDSDPLAGPPKRAAADLFRARSVAGAPPAALEPPAAAPAPDRPTSDVPAPEPAMLAPEPGDATTAPGAAAPEVPEAAGPEPAGDEDAVTAPAEADPAAAQAPVPPRRRFLSRLLRR